MGSYTFSVNSQTDAGSLTWNPNGTLQKLVISDQLNTFDSQTCAYTYDDLARIGGKDANGYSVDCGAVWQQLFTYDPFGNVTKTGSSTFQPTYSSTTNQLTISGANVNYDANGNLLTDNLNTYTWDPNWGSLLTVDGTAVTATYDALGSMIETNAGGSYTEFIYGPTGTKLATANEQTLVKAFIALPGGAKAIYNSTGLAYYRHSDWLGSSRLTSSGTKPPPTSLYSSTAYAPFGEQYATSGTEDASFTGQDQDTVSSLYDFPSSRLSPSQGRLIAPNPGGIGGVSPASPQTWNRYGYTSGHAGHQAPGSAIAGQTMPPGTSVGGGQKSPSIVLTRKQLNALLNVLRTEAIGTPAPTGPAPLIAPSSLSFNAQMNAITPTINFTWWWCTYTTNVNTLYNCSQTPANFQFSVYGPFASGLMDGGDPTGSGNDGMGSPTPVAPQCIGPSDCGAPMGSGSGGGGGDGGLLLCWLGIPCTSD
jgi:hypothetical protein